MVSFTGQVEPELRPRAQFRFSDEQFHPFNMEVIPLCSSKTIAVNRFTCANWGKFWWH